MKELIHSVHSMSGILIALIGLTQYFLPKFSPWHRGLGITYSLLWFPLLFSGAWMGSWIITALGALGFYCVLTGWRFTRSKEIPRKPIDKLIVVIAALLVTALGIGALLLLRVGNIDFAIIMGVFALIFGWFVSTDFREVILGKKVRKLSTEMQYWFFEHYTRMTISMITALTAFSAIQQLFSSTIVNWLWPTVVGTLLLFVFGAHYRKKVAIST
jgi:hypothetical protein